MVHLTVNGKPVDVHQGAMLLEAVRAAGIGLPTLCYHEGLAPYGACRLCMVTITAPRPALVAACAHPAEEGLDVETGAPQAVAARRLALEFLLCRAPTSDLIRELAACEGVVASRFSPPPQLSRGVENCVLCGLCVRLCREAIGAAALCFVDRGSERFVGTPFGLQAAACIGCGACAEICPTGAIQIEDRGSQRFLRTWNTMVELTICPGCGRYFAPRPMALLGEILPETVDLWSACPDCRRAETSRQWLESQT